MSYRNAARAAALLLMLTLLGSACGKKGPLYLPDGARAGAPAVVLAHAGSAAGPDSR